MTNKKLMKNLFLSLVMILFIILLIEIFLQINFRSYYNIDRFQKGNFRGNILQNKDIPNRLKIYDDFQALINNRGFRDDNFTINTSDNIIRFAILGDSFTFGHGLNNTNDTYPQVLESMLKNNNQKYEVMNFGINGANILDIFWVLKYRVLEYDPDIIIYGFYVNDAEFYSHNFEVEFCRLFEKNPNWIINDIFNIRTDNIINKINNNNHLKFNPDFKNTAYYTQLLNENYYGWKCFKHINTEFSVLSKNTNIPFVTFVISNLNHPNYNDLFIEKKVIQQATQNNLLIIPGFLNKFWDKTNGSEIMVSINNHHLNKKANKIIAEILYDYLLESDLLKKNET